MMRAASTAAAAVFTLLLLLAGPALGSPLARLPASAAAVRLHVEPTRRQEQEQDTSFSEFEKPREDDVFATGSQVLVAWTTGSESAYDGTIVLELGKAPLRTFVHTEYDIPFSQGSLNWTVPSDVEPGSYALRLAQSTTPTTFVDSPVFSISGDTDTTAAATQTDAPPLPPPRPHREGLSEGQKIGIGTGIGLAVCVVLCAVWIWRYNGRQRRVRFARGGGGGSGNEQQQHHSASSRGGLGGIAGAQSWGNMSPRTVVASSPVTEHMEEGDKLPDGVMSGWGPGSLEPVELPTDMYDGGTPRRGGGGGSESRDGEGGTTTTRTASSMDSARASSATQREGSGVVVVEEVPRMSEDTTGRGSDAETGTGTGPRTGRITDGDVSPV